VGYALVRRWPKTPLGTWSLCVVTGGALGNFIDRAVNGYVVDMFEFDFIDFAIFNVADVFITVGGILFCLYLLFVHEKKEQKEGERDAASPI
jgi:signal peptidase II